MNLKSVELSLAEPPWDIRKYFFFIAVIVQIGQWDLDELRTAFTETGYSKQDILNERVKVKGYIKYELIAWLFLGRS